MFNNFFQGFIKESAGIYQVGSKLLYQLLSSRFIRVSNFKFINYGYAEETRETSLDFNNCGRNLYVHLIGAHQLKGSRVVEVGCGRGGGCETMMSYAPERVTGVDLSENAINFCRKSYQMDGLTFEVGNSENLPFKNEEFDYLLNVESSHNYNNRAAFFAEVRRVLRPDGTFLYTDFMSRKHYHKRVALLIASGFDIVAEQEITDQVLRALILTSDQKESLIKGQLTLLPLRSLCRDFVGTKGSTIFKFFESREGIYFSLVCKKSNGAPVAA